MLEVIKIRGLQNHLIQYKNDFRFLQQHTRCVTAHKVVLFATSMVRSKVKEVTSVAQPYDKLGHCGEDMREERLLSCLYGNYFLVTWNLVRYVLLGEQSRSMSQKLGNRWLQKCVNERIYLDIASIRQSPKWTEGDQTKLEDHGGWITKFSDFFETKNNWAYIMQATA